MAERIKISWGHIYGKPFGFREIKAAMKKVDTGEWQEISRTKWKSVGKKNGLKHGYDAVFIVTKEGENI